MKRNHLSLAIGLILAAAVRPVLADDATAGSLASAAASVSADASAPANTQTSATADAAAETTAEEKAKAKAKETPRLNAVTVTARRREETLQDVPVAVTAFTPETIDKLNVRDIGDLDAQVPNLTIYAARGSNTTLTAYIRGVGQSDPLWGVDPGVGLYLDDVYIARPQGALLDVFDIGRIEVLRGPQGTLYGKNTVGGAIKYISRDLPTEFEGVAEVGTGSYGEANFKAAVGGALGQGVRARLAVASLTRGGFGENIITGVDVSDKDTKAARFTLGIFPGGDTFDARLELDYTSDTSGVRGAQMLTTNRFDPSVPDHPVLSDRYDVRSGFYPDNSTTSGGASFTMNWRPNDAWRFKSISAWRKSDTETSIDFDTLPAALADVHAGYHDKQLSQEFQGAYDNGGKLTGVMGIYWFKGEAGGLVKNIFLRKADLPPFFPNPPGAGFPGQYGTTNGIVYTKSIAGYADFDYAFTDKFSVGAGLRWTQEEKNGVVKNQSFANINFNPPTLTIGFDKTITFTNVSPKFTLDYKLSDDALIYGSWSRGFKSGGYNIRASVLPNSQLPYQDEQVDSLEIGTKLAFADQRAFLNFALFHNKYKDIQLSVFTTCTVNNVQTFCGDFTNAGQGTVQGAEVEFQFRPNDHWNFSGNLAKLDAKFDEYLFKGFNIADQQEFTNAPDFSGAINAEYRTAVGERGDISFRGTYSYQSEVTATTEVTLDPVTHVVTKPIHQDGYGLLSAGVIYRTGGAWTFSLQGTNLNDKAYLTTGYVVPSVGVRTGFYGAPRQWSLSARYEF
ncbi:TonB-dependent receptor [soil metagenome]